MLDALFILVFAVVVGAVEIPSLTRRNLKKEAWFYVVLLLAGTILSMLYAFDVKLPNPMAWMNAIYRPLSDAVTQALR